MVSIITTLGLGNGKAIDLSTGSHSVLSLTIEPDDETAEQKRQAGHESSKCKPARAKQNVASLFYWANPAYKYNCLPEKAKEICRPNCTLG